MSSLLAALWAGNGSRRFGQTVSRASHAYVDHVRMAVLQLRRRGDAKGVPAVSITCIREILPELVCGECH